MTNQQPKAMRTFTVLWLGQALSLLGSAMTWFAFTIWVWEKTGQAASLAFVSFFTFLPSLLFSPFVGTLVDRWNRKLTLMISDMASAIATFIAFFIYINFSLELWHVYLLGLLTGIFTAFQYPAYITLTTVMLPREHYARAEGMMGLAQAFAGIAAPLAAALLLPKIGMEGIMILDLITFIAAFSTLLWIKLPPRTPPIAAQSTRGGFLREASFGFSYIYSRPSLRALILLFMFTNFFLAMGATLMAPMILSLTGSKNMLATIQSSGAMGGIVGGLLLSIWGGPRKRIFSILLGGVGACLLGVTGLGLGRGVFVWVAASFFFAFFEPFVEGGNLAVWQSKVDVGVQGRVLSVHRLMVQVPFLLGMAASGWLADHAVFPDFFSNNYSALLIMAGLCGTAAFSFGFSVPSLRNAEAILPDLTQG